MANWRGGRPCNAWCGLNGVLGNFEPLVGNAANLLEIIEQICIQNIFSEGAVEALDVGILFRLAGLDMQQRNVLFSSPQLSNRLL